MFCPAYLPHPDISDPLTLALEGSFLPRVSTLLSQSRPLLSRPSVYKVCHDLHVFPTALREPSLFTYKFARHWAKRRRRAEEEIVWSPRWHCPSQSQERSLSCRPSVVPSFSPALIRSGISLWTLSTLRLMPIEEKIALLIPLLFYSLKGFWLSIKGASRGERSKHSPLPPPMNGSFLKFIQEVI